MRVLLANLRLFWRRVSLWSLYVYVFLAAGFAVLIAWMQLGTPTFPAVAVLFPLLAVGVLPISQIVAFMQDAILSPPFVFTLPGHQSAVRQTVFVAGLAVSLGVTLIVLPSSRAIGHPVLTLGAIFSLSLAFYLVGVVLTYLLVFPGVVITAIGAGMAFTGHDGGLRTGLVRIVGDSPLSVILASLLGAAVVWWCMGRLRRDARITLWAQECVSRRPLRNHTARRGLADSASNRFLLDRVQAATCSSSVKYIWGALYAWSGNSGGWRKEMFGTLVAALGVALLAWYMPSAGPLLIVGATSTGDISKWPPFSNLLIAGGRWERFLGMLALLLVLGSVWTISIALSFSLVDLAQPYLPQAKSGIADIEPRIPPMNIRLAILLTATYPIWALIYTALGRSTRRYAAGLALLLLGSLPGVYVPHWRPGIPLVVVALIVSWAISMYGLYRVVMRKDFVPTRPEKPEPDWSWPEIRDMIRESRKRART